MIHEVSCHLLLWLCNYGKSEEREFNRSQHLGGFIRPREKTCAVQFSVWLACLVYSGKIVGLDLLSRFQATILGILFSLPYVLLGICKLYSTLQVQKISAKHQLSTVICKDNYMALKPLMSHSLFLINGNFCFIQIKWLLNIL